MYYKWHTRVIKRIESTWDCSFYAIFDSRNNTVDISRDQMLIKKIWCFVYFLYVIATSVTIITRLDDSYEFVIRFEIKQLRPIIYDVSFLCCLRSFASIYDRPIITQSTCYYNEMRIIWISSNYNDILS